MAYCSKCGTQLGDGDIFCPKCGTPCDDIPVTPRSNSEVEEIEENDKTSIKKYGGIALLFVILLLIIGGSRYFWKRHSTDTSEVVVPAGEVVSETIAVDTMEILAKSIEGCEKLFQFKHGIAAIVKDGKIGIVNKKGDVIAPVIYELAINFDENRTSCYAYLSEGLIRLLKNGKYGFIDITGKVIIPFSYEHAGNLKDGLVYVQVNGKWGYINKVGEKIIPFIYDEASEFNEGLAKVTKDDEVMYINSTGKTIINLGKDYNECGDFVHGIAYVKNSSSGLYGFIDRKGNLIVPCKYERINYNFYDGLMLVQNDDGDGYIDKSGKEVIQCQYGMAFDFYEGVARTFEEYGGKYGHYINTKGEEIFDIDDKFDEYNDFHEGLAAVKKGGVYGYINKHGNIVLDFKYDYAGRFSENYAIIKKGEKYGYIDHTGSIVIPCNYDDAGNFQEGFAVVKKDGITGFIDKNGKTTINYSTPHNNSGKEIDNSNNSVDMNSTNNDSQQRFNAEIMRRGNEIAEIMRQINNIYNQYVARRGSLDPTSKQIIGVNATGDISDLMSEGDMLFREMISIARKEGKQELIPALQQERNGFKEKAHRMCRSITNDIYN